MFTVDCPRHETRVLLGSRAIEALVPTPDGIALHWRCRCGARGTTLTGRRSSGVTEPIRTAANAA